MQPTATVLDRRLNFGTSPIFTFYESSVLVVMIYTIQRMRNENTVSPQNIDIEYFNSRDHQQQTQFNRFMFFWGTIVKSFTNQSRFFKESQV